MPEIPLPDLSADEPAGPNLEFDADFAEFERLAQGKPEQQYGATIIPAEEPVWKDLVLRAGALLDRTYDLRIMANLAVARLQHEGAAGYADSLGLIRHVLETRWEQVHPQLDPEDDNDPTLRGNALLLAADSVRVLRVLRTMPLARSPRAGVVTWRDIAIANGTLEAGDQAKIAEPVIRAAFAETDQAALTALQSVLALAADHARAIPAAFDAAAGYGTGPDFTELTKLLADMQRMVAAFKPLEQDLASDDPEPGAAAADGEPAARVRSGLAGNIGMLGPVTNRADAIKLMDLVVDYYARNEPSSPLPLLISRARRLADKSFLDILRDLAPDGLSQAEKIVGTIES